MIISTMNAALILPPHEPQVKKQEWFVDSFFFHFFLLSMIFFYLCIAWNGYGLLTKHVSWYYSVSFSIFLIWKYSTVNDLFSLLFKFQSFIYFLPARVVAWWYSTLTQLSGGRWFESQEVLWISRKIRDSYQSNLIELQKKPFQIPGYGRNWLTLR